MIYSNFSDGYARVQPCLLIYNLLFYFFLIQFPLTSLSFFSCAHKFSFHLLYFPSPNTDIVSSAAVYIHLNNKDFLIFFICPTSLCFDLLSPFLNYLSLPYKHMSFPLSDQLCACSFYLISHLYSTQLALLLTGKTFTILSYFTSIIICDVSLNIILKVSLLIISINASLNHLAR